MSARLARARPLRRGLLALLLVPALLVGGDGAVAVRAARAASGDPPATDVDPDTEIARTHFRRGEELYARGRYAEAVREFDRARQARPLPALDYNIARAYDRMDRPDDAVRAYEAYLRMQPGAPDAAEVRARVAILRARSDERRAHHGAPAARPGETAPDLRPRGPDPTATASPDLTGSRAAAPPRAPEAPAAARPRPRRYFLGAPVALGVGALVLAGAIATGVGAHVYYQDLKSQCSPGGACSYPSAASDLSRGQSYALASDVLLGVGLAVTGGGVALAILERTLVRRGPAPPTVTAAPLVGRGLLGLVLEVAR